jgi:hypothetical protein
MNHLRTYIRTYVISISTQRSVLTVLGHHPTRSILKFYNFPSELMGRNEIVYNIALFTTYSNRAPPRRKGNKHESTLGKIFESVRRLKNKKCTLTASPALGYVPNNCRNTLYNAPINGATGCAECLGSFCLRESEFTMAFI